MLRISGTSQMDAGSASGCGPGRPCTDVCDPEAVADAADEDSLWSRLRRELECPICSLLMLPSYIICANGHYSCLPCHAKLLEMPRGGRATAPCPTCKGPLLAQPIKNLQIEAAAQTIPMPCYYVEDGCPAKNLTYGQIKAHGEACPWRPVACGFDVGPGRTCGAMHCLQKMPRHFASAHRAELNATPCGAVYSGDGSTVARMEVAVSWPPQPAAAPASAGAQPHYHPVPLTIQDMPVSMGGAFGVDLVRAANNELYAGVRVFGRASQGPMPKLAHIVVEIGGTGAAATRLQFALSRPLQPNESVLAAARESGTLPAAMRIDLEFLKFCVESSRDAKLLLVKKLRLACSLTFTSEPLVKL